MTMENLLILICFIVMLAHLSAGEIEITALQGQNTTLPCNFEGIPWYVAWLKGEELHVIARYVGNRIIYPGNTEKYSVQKDFSSVNSSFSLTIADVELVDAGQYRCAVTDQNGALYSSLYNLTVLVPPELPYPRIVPMIPDSDGGQPINLTCRADRGSIGLTKLYWMNNDTMHIQQEMISYPNADGTTENVTSVIEAYPSEKPYTCVATLNTSGHENAMASVNIRPLHLSTPITPTPTVTTTRQNETTTDDTGSVNSRSIAWKIAVGVIFGVFIIAVALVIIAVNRKRIGEAIKQGRCQRTPTGRTMYQLSTTTNKDDNEDDNENEEVNETVC